MEVSLVKNGILFKEDTSISCHWVKTRGLPLVKVENGWFLAMWNNGLFKNEVQTLAWVLLVGGVDADLTGVWFI